MNKILKALLVNSSYLYLIQGLNYLLPLLVLPYLIKTLDQTSFGIFAYSQSFMQILALIVDFGFNLSITKKIASLPSDSKEVVDLYWLVSMIKFVLFFLLAVLVGIGFYFFSALAIYQEAVWWSLLTLLGSVLFPIWLYQGLNKMKQLSFIGAASKLLTFPFIFITVTGKGDYLPAVILSSASYLLAGLIAVVAVLSDPFFRRFSGASINFHAAKEQLRYAWPVFISNSAISLYTSSLTVILGFFGTTAQVGLFGAIERIVKAVCFGLYVPLNQAAFPTLAKLASTDFSTARRLLKTIFWVVAGLMTGICFVTIALESYFIKYFFEGLNGVEVLLRVSIFTIIPIALGAVCGQLGLMALGGDVQKQQFSRVYTTVGAGSILCSVLAIRFFQTEGAVFSMMITECIIFAAMFSYVKKYRYM